MILQLQNYYINSANISYTREYNKYYYKHPLAAIWNEETETIKAWEVGLTCGTKIQITEEEYEDLLKQVWSQ